MWGEHTQIGLDPHKSSSLFQHYCAQRNIGRFFAPLVGSRLSNSSFVEGMWRHAGVSASKFAKVFRKAAEINENMWNYNQGMWTDTGVSAVKVFLKVFENAQPQVYDLFHSGRVWHWWEKMSQWEVRSARLFFTNCLELTFWRQILK